MRPVGVLVPMPLITATFPSSQNLFIGPMLGLNPISSLRGITLSCGYALWGGVIVTPVAIGHHSVEIVIPAGKLDNYQSLFMLGSCHFVESSPRLADFSKFTMRG